ncbi:hypothetical protein BCR44DRAFT_1431526 [Catenaria anguillulae PL171]|uniref:S-adenosyl-L-methionine-dependent methyltransferase n=1 Tax=Catenaria anguillulae PL171 TaxID=765915 RepID=A0A1Y2HVI2_9FUNG|nr:hypothetical protein BCR44DRAFT_1431526 [Catenaria anguillulae PL171]
MNECGHTTQRTRTLGKHIDRMQSTLSFICGLALGVGVGVSLSAGCRSEPSSSWRWSQWSQWTWNSSAPNSSAQDRSIPSSSSWAEQCSIDSQPQPRILNAAIDPARLGLLAGLLTSDALTYASGSYSHHPHAAPAGHHQHHGQQHRNFLADTTATTSPNSSPRLAPLASIGPHSGTGSPIPASSSSSSTSSSRRILRGHARSTSRDLSSTPSSSLSSFLLPTTRSFSTQSATTTLPSPPPTVTELAQVLLTHSPDSLYSDAHLALNVRPVSGFMNVGLWTDPFSSTRPDPLRLPCDLTTAGQSLVRLVAEFGNLRGKRVMDVGYGLGDSSLMLHVEFACDVLGITYSAQQAAIAHLRASRLGLASSPPGLGGSGVHLYQGDAADLEHEWRTKLDAVPVDAIISIDSAYHYNPRSAFFNQAFTVLSHTHANTPRPPLSPSPLVPADSDSPTSGPSRHRSRTPSTGSTPSPRPTLVTLDLIIPSTLLGRLVSRLAHIPSVNLGNILDYERQVSRAGFVHVEMLNVSRAVFPGLTRYLTGRRLESASSGVWPGGYGGSCGGGLACSVCLSGQRSLHPVL